MRNILCLCSLLLLLSHTAYAHVNGGGDTDSSRFKAIGQPIETQLLRAFPDLDKYLQQTAGSNQSLNVSYGTTSEFTPDYINNAYPVSDVVADARAQAAQTFSEIDRLGRFIDILTGQDLVELPIGMKKRLGNTNVTIGVAKVKFQSTYAELTVFCKIDLPQGKTIFFGSDNVQLSYGGGISGNARLVLLGDFAIPINGGNSMITLKGGLNMSTGQVSRTDVTGVTMTCSSVENLSVAADVTFPRSLIEPVGDDFKVIADQTQKVKGSFVASSNITDFNDIYAAITLPKFAIRGLSKVCFQVTGAVFDFSDTKNPGALPTNYGNIPQGNTNLWRGVFIQSIDVYLPKEFKKKGAGTDDRVRIVGTNTNGTTIEGRNIIIDNWGFTGLVSATNVFQDGTASGWDFSVDKFEINVQANTLRGASFEGSIAIPVSKKKSTDTQVNQYGFGYRAMFSADNSYMMNVQLKQDIAFDVWQAKVNLGAGSYIELTAINEVFRPVAYLNGSMGIEVITKHPTDATLNRKDVQFNGITFKGLKLETESPYIFIPEACFGYTSTNSLVSNFPLTISKIKGEKVGNDLKITADFNLNLMESSSFSASASVTVVGQIVSTNNGLSYDYNRTDFNSASMKGDFNSFYIEGGIKFMRNHPEMGNGFAGDLTIQLKLNTTSPGIKVAGAFGRKQSTINPSETFRYWYVDALVSGLKIPIATGLDITGLGGGASYKMKKVTKTIGTVKPSNDPYPYSFTGAAYQPDERTGLGLRAMVTLGIKGDVGVGEACLEMAFNAYVKNTTTGEVVSGGGLKSIGLFGKARIMLTKKIDTNNPDVPETTRLNDGLNSFTSELDGYPEYDGLVEAGNFDKIAKDKQTTKPVIAAPNSEIGNIVATLGIQYDFASKTLVGNIDAKMEVKVGTTNLLTGEGKIRLKFSPNEWYLYVGEPDFSKRFTTRLGASEGVKGSPSTTNGAGILIGVYFVVGSTIPNTPPPPTQVAEILRLKLDALNNMRNLDAISSGAGFAFGANIFASTGDLKAGPFYAKFDAGVGFDIMVKRYLNTNYVCGISPAQAVGMNGWYATGQAYAYLQGELGIDTWAGKFPIISAGAAVLLQAKLPNPTLFAGYMSGYYSVFGGVFTGRFDMKVKIGKGDCRLESEPIEPPALITNISPAHGTTNVDIMALPRADLRYPLYLPFSLPRDNGVTDTYMIDSFSVEFKNLTNPAANEMFMIVPSMSDLTSVSMHEMSQTLAPNTQYKFKVSVRLNKLDTIVDENVAAGFTVRWDSIKRETLETIFTTGPAPTGIPLSNIEYSYPVMGQKYFHVGESNRGFIKLKRGMGELLNNSPTEALSVHFCAQRKDGLATMGALNIPANYDPMSKIISFATDDYNWILSSWTYNQSIVIVKRTIPDNDRGSGSPFVSRPGRKVLLRLDFNSSKYKTFKEKMEAKFGTPTNRTVSNTTTDLYPNVPILGAMGTGAGDEPFDMAELRGTQGSGYRPLIMAEAVLTDNYYNNTMKPLFYDWLGDQPPAHPYGYYGYTSRNRAKIGMPPTKTVGISAAYEQAMSSTESVPVATEDNLPTIGDPSSGPSSSTILGKMFPFSYMAAKYYDQDFYDLKQYYPFGGCRRFGTTGKLCLEPIVIPYKLIDFNSRVTCPIMPNGTYPAKFKYILPDGSPGQSGLPPAYQPMYEMMGRSGMFSMMRQMAEAMPSPMSDMMFNHLYAPIYSFDFNFVKQ